MTHGLEVIPTRLRHFDRENTAGVAEIKREVSRELTLLRSFTPLLVWKPKPSTRTTMFTTTAEDSEVVKFIPLDGVQNRTTEETEVAPISQIQGRTGEVFKVVPQECVQQHTSYRRELTSP